MFISEERRRHTASMAGAMASQLANSPSRVCSNARSLWNSLPASRAWPRALGAVAARRRGGTGHLDAAAATTRASAPSPPPALATSTRPASSPSRRHPTVPLRHRWTWRRRRRALHRRVLAVLLLDASNEETLLPRAVREAAPPRQARSAPLLRHGCLLRRARRASRRALRRPRPGARQDRQLRWLGHVLHVNCFRCLLLGTLMELRMMFV